MSDDFNFDYDDVSSQSPESSESYSRNYIETIYDGKLEPISEEMMKDVRDFEYLCKFDDVFVVGEDKGTGITLTDNIEVRCPSQEKAHNRHQKGKEFVIGKIKWILSALQEDIKVFEKPSDTEETSIEEKIQNRQKEPVSLSEAIAEGQGELISESKGKVRTYNKTAVMPKNSFAKPLEEGGAFVKKLLLFLAACVVLGIVVGIKANSYYIVHDNESALNCAIMWIMEEGVPMSIDPFYANVFATGFLLGFGLLGIIGLFTYLDSEQKKHSRVGHEHGSAHLATSKDFKIYKNKFMED